MLLESNGHIVHVSESFLSEYFPACHKKPQETQLNAVLPPVAQLQGTGMCAVSVGNVTQEKEAGSTTRSASHFTQVTMVLAWPPALNDDQGVNYRLSPGLVSPVTQRLSIFCRPCRQDRRA